MNVMKWIISIAVIAVAIFSLFNPGISVTSLMLTLVGAMFLIMGAQEIKKEKKAIGYLLIAVALFNIFVSVQHVFVS